MARGDRLSRETSQQQRLADEERPKRRKISQACQQCRARKSRCDGAKPVCSECAQRLNQKDPCRYSSNRHADQSHDDYVTSLLTRIQSLEAQAQRSLPADTHASPQRSEEVTISANSCGIGHATVHQLQDVSPIVYEEVSPVDAMGANANVVRPEEQDDRFYGSSSTVSFVQQVYRAIGNDRLVSRETSPTPLQATFSGIQSLGQTWDVTMLDQMTLLPRPFMDQVLNVYWDKVYRLYPFVHKPTFMQAYELLWRSDSSGDGLVVSSIGMLGSKGYGPGSIIFHCALNSLLALAVQFMDLPPADRATIGQRLAEKSRNLCRLDLFDDGSLAMVQTLLLMAQYLQSTPYPTRCWNCIGISCRMAQGLGLHVEGRKTQKRLDPLEIEMCRRVWHGCAMLDTVVSMTLGRPMMLYKHESPPLPSQRDDEWLTVSIPAEDRLSWIAFYVESIKVYKILADVVSQFYGRSNVSHDSSDMDTSLEIVLRIDSALSKLEQSTPDHLHPTKRLSSPSELGALPVLVQQASVLRARCLYVRILLYRPIFTRYCQSLCTHDSVEPSGISLPGLTQLSIAFVKSLSVACVEYSIKLVETVNQSALASTTGAWWYNLFYARNAGIVILLAMAFIPISESVGMDNLNAAWTKCQELLNFLQSFSSTVAGCLRGLNRMHRHISRQRARQGQQGPPNALSATGNQDPLTNKTGSLSFGTPTSTSAGNIDLAWLSETDAALFDEIFNIDFGQILPEEYG